MYISPLLGNDIEIIRETDKEIFLVQFSNGPFKIFRIPNILSSTTEDFFRYFYVVGKVSCLQLNCFFNIRNVIVF